MSRYDEIQYSESITDKLYEYRHVKLTKAAFEKYTIIINHKIEKRQPRVLNETEWRSLGLAMSRGWENLKMWKHEPEVMMFRRPIGTNRETGERPVDFYLKEQNFDKYKYHVMQKQKFDIDICKDDQLRIMKDHAQKQIQRQQADKQFETVRSQQDAFNVGDLLNKLEFQN